MGEAYRATDTRLGRDVVLKALFAEMASSPERLERFRREAKPLAALDHPGILTVYFVEEAEGVHFLTMQLVDGEPLDRLISEGRDAGRPAAEDRNRPRGRSTRAPPGRAVMPRPPRTGRRRRSPSLPSPT
jgi:serine/threonine protein kinase